MWSPINFLSERPLKGRYQAMFKMIEVEAGKSWFWPHSLVVLPLALRGRGLPIEKNHEKNRWQSGEFSSR